MITTGITIGIDIGGTNIVAALVSSDGQVLARHTIATEAQRGPQSGMQRIGDLVETLLRETEKSRVSGIGIGCTGPLDSERGRIQNPYTLPTWDDVPLVEALEARFGLRAYLIHDCAAAALGEHWVGAGRGARHMIYITIGTGIGAGFILDGRLHRGLGLLSGEVGHTVIDLNGPACYCGARGCWEMFAAAPAIARRAAERAPADSLLLRLANRQRDAISARLVRQAADAGDPLANTIMDETAFYLGVGIANLMNIFAPEVVVIGGGVALSWDRFAPIATQTIHARSGMMPFARMKIVQASLGLNAGVTGAARGLLMLRAADEA
ncbi:MAG: ROK family protein [Chloroflexi bacterium]|nr:ROK family protein [Chloroflexota bacterium]